jgi:hypothetical protein
VGLWVVEAPIRGDQRGSDRAWPPGATSQDLLRYWAGADAAWYPDPTRPDMIRYWDGARWTSLVTPTPPPLALLREATGPALAGYPLPATTPAAKKPAWRRHVDSVLGRHVDSVLGRQAQTSAVSSGVPTSPACP